MSENRRGGGWVTLYILSHTITYMIGGLLLNEDDYAM